MKELVLRGSGITDSSLGYLKEKKGITAVMLDNPKVSDAGLGNLRGLSGLRLIDLSKTAITDAGASQVREWFPLAGVKPAPSK